MHPTALQGFGEGAEAYARGRPGYPPAIAGWARRTLGLASGSHVVDLGAGTGKLTQRLIETGAAVTAVEPVEAMRTAFRAAHPDVPALSGTAEAIPLGDRSCDAVLCGQAFHWFANARALAEIRRVLKPGGRLGLVWNRRDERVPWVRALSDLMQPYEGETPRVAGGAWRTVFPADGFGPLRETELAHHVTGPPEAVIVDRVLSVSFIASLPVTERESVRQSLVRLMAATPELAGQDEITFPYLTEAYHCVRME
ncbi:MAG: methyltransferase domain-containing protein [Hyphomicrobiaceae bacterium]